MDLVEAHADLSDYPATYGAPVDRGTRRMRSDGWATVQGCADMNIAAAHALERMQKR